MALACPSDQKPKSIASFRVRILYPFVGREFRDCFLVRTHSAKQRSSHGEIGGVNVAQVHLAFDFRHACPGVEYVGDTMAPQAGEVIRRQEFGIANFYGVSKIAGQRRQKRVQFREKRAGVCVAVLRETAELQNQRGHSGPIWRQRIQKAALKQVGVQEGGIVVARARATSRIIDVT